MDHRDAAAMRGKWYDSLDQDRMIVVVELYSDETDEDEEVEVPVKFEVCSVCRGKGSHVNPSIDSGGLTAEDFAENPGFKEDYFGGVYDVTCYGCGGQRVEPVVDNDKLDEKMKVRMNEFFDNLSELEAERASEMRWGY